MMRLRSILLLSLLLALPLKAANEAGSDAVLTPNGTLLIAQRSADGHALQLVSTNGEKRVVENVPLRDSVTRVSDPRIAWDAHTNTLIVLSRQTRGREGDDIVTLTRDTEGIWSAPHLVVCSESSCSGPPQIAVTRPQSTNVLLLHAVWLDGDRPQYQLLAFEGAHLISKYATDLGDFAACENLGTNDDVTTRPLTIASENEEVDIVFGLPASITLSRVTFKPRLDARVWVPGGRQINRTPYQNLDSVSTIRALTAGGHIVLYTVDGNIFRYAIEANGEWQPTRALRIDEKVSVDAIVRELRRAAN
ncbi:MAG TPA: hypothetical protein VMU84_02785 [Thermoanaerobaculia bacterium]|nr:hypothetical protein [Thermoanaerobaculia bacterium]